MVESGEKGDTSCGDEWTLIEDTVTAELAEFFGNAPKKQGFFTKIVSFISFSNEDAVDIILKVNSLY